MDQKRFPRTVVAFLQDTLALRSAQPIDAMVGDLAFKAAILLSSRRSARSRPAQLAHPIHIRQPKTQAWSRSTFPMPLDDVAYTQVETITRRCTG